MQPSIARKIIGAVMLILPVSGWAGEVEVVKVDVRCEATRICDFDVTLKHADEGWEHYANQWRLETPSGEVVGVRELLHPHVNEQPFTRSLTGVTVPEGVQTLIVCASDSVHGRSSQCPSVSLPL
ncbi:hypothetical protein BTA51_08495 [Hahella sp. CCB-MM4]|nr:hypothetical protein BTA51_08495 [Hahella sp. CCB-MM4]